MKKRIVIIIVVVLVVAALAAGGWWLWVTYGQDAEDDVLGGSGTVEAHGVDISSVIAAPIATVELEEGAAVTSGTVLFRLDQRILDLQVEQADAGVRAAQAALDQAIADGATQAEQDRLRARVDQAQAVKQLAEVQAEFATISSPMDGTLIQLTAAAGETASPGKTLATVSDLDRLFVSIFVGETDIGQVSIGQQAVVTTDSSDREFSGEVVFIASEAEFTPTNIETREQRVKLVYEVRLAVEDSSGVLKPGMPVDVEF